MPDKYPKGHPPRYWRKHPAALAEVLRAGKAHDEALVTPASEPPLHESTLLWTAINTFFSVLFGITLAVTRDLRWLLPLAWPWAALGIWKVIVATIQPVRKRWAYILGGWSVSALALVLIGLLIHPKIPAIEASYDIDLLGLPLSVQPDTTLELVVIRDDGTVEVQGVKNLERGIYYWPTEKNIDPPEMVGKIRLINHGDEPAFNISYSARISLSDKNGTEMERSIELPLVDLPANGSPVFFNVVNQSSYSAIVNLTDWAFVSVQGEPGRTKIKVNKRGITFFDNIPLLWASKHKWEGNTLLLGTDSSKRTKSP